jgi:hypothetical protein
MGGDGWKSDYKNTPSECMVKNFKKAFSGVNS